MLELKDTRLPDRLTTLHQSLLRLFNCIRLKISWPSLGIRSGYTASSPLKSRDIPSLVSLTTKGISPLEVLGFPADLETATAMSFG